MMEHAKKTPCDPEKVAIALNEWLHSERATALDIAEKHGVTIQCMNKAFEEWRQKGNR